MYSLILLFWIILNGKINLEIILLGLFFTILLGLLIKYLFNYTPEKEIAYLKRVPCFVFYVFVLAKEIIKANITMLKIVVDKENKISPILIKFHTGLKTSFGNFILANSITLTPGTITVSASGDEFVVHCLREDMLDTSKNNPLLKLIMKMEDM